jgi:transcriptional regulator with XRE-family HTH domain
MPTSRGAQVGELCDAHELAHRRLIEMGKRIREARESADMSRTELANALGVVHMTVYRYETAKRPLSIPIVEDIAYQTGTLADWIFTGKGPMRARGAAA